MPYTTVYERQEIDDFSGAVCTYAAGLGLMLVGCNQDVGVVRNKNKEPVATIHTPTDQSVFTEGDPLILWVPSPMKMVRTH